MNHLTLSPETALLLFIASGIASYKICVEECYLLGCGAMQILCGPIFWRKVSSLEGSMSEEPAGAGGCRSFETDLNFFHSHRDCTAD
jgi:hypothetical protein